MLRLLNIEFQKLKYNKSAKVLNHSLFYHTIIHSTYRLYRI